MPTKLAGEVQGPQIGDREAQAQAQEAQPQRTFKVLALDGGGIRGVAVSRILEEIEAKTGKPIHKLFDLVIGTSTGGLLSVMMTVPQLGHENDEGPSNGIMSASEARQFYFKYGSTIFNRSAWYATKYYADLKGKSMSKYPRDGMDQVIKIMFGENKTLADAKINVGVVCTDRVHKSTVVFNNRADDSQSEFRTEDNIAVHVDHVHHPKLNWVVPATSAAPTYFDPVILEYTGEGEAVPVTEVKEARSDKTLILEDGGVNQNNPANLGFKEAKRILKLEKFDLNKCKIDILSIGTGTICESGDEDDPAIHDPTYWSISKGWGGAFEELTSDPFKMGMKSFATHKKLKAKFSKKDREFIYGKYSRVQYTVTSDQLKHMDDASDSNMKSLCTAAETFIFGKDKKDGKYTQNFKDIIHQIDSTIQFEEDTIILSTQETAPLIQASKLQVS